MNPPRSDEGCSDQSDPYLWLEGEEGPESAFRSGVVGCCLLGAGLIGLGGVVWMVVA